MSPKAETDKFLPNSSPKSKTCFSTWWNQGFPHQETICAIIDSYKFRVLIICLVVLDTSLIITELMLDSFKIQSECEHTTSHHDKKTIERVELAMIIIHYTSITILVLFVIELFVKIHSFAKEFWNIRRKKMEYFDAFIVITSLIIDIYCLHVEKKILGEKLLLIFTFRLWRFVRIISSVGEGIRHGQIKHKKHLNKQYLASIQRLIDLLLYKTKYIEEEQNNDKVDMNSILEHFRTIDSQCQSSLKKLNDNHELTSTDFMEQFLEQIERLEHKDKDKSISAMFAKSPKV